MSLLHKNNISIKEIAKITGVSHTTVSLCLNKSKGYERISKRTKDKISKVAKEYNYKKNNHASSLRTNASPLIGLIVPTLNDRFFARLSEEFQEGAFKMELFPIVSVCKNNYEIEKQSIDNFIANSISSIFIASSSRPDELMNYCKSHDVFSVCFDNIAKIGVSLTSDNYTSSYDLTTKLLEKSNYDKNILFMGGSKNNYTAIERLNGFKQALLDNHINFNESSVIYCDYSAKDAFNILSKFIKEGKLKTHTVYFNSLVVLEGGVKAIKEHYNIDNYIIGSYDYHKFLDITNLNIISVKQHSKTMVVEAFKHLKNYKSTKDYKDILVKIPATFVDNTN